MLTISTKTQYAVRALLYIARNSKTLCTTAEIAQAEGISVKYLENILSVLKCKGILDSERGKHGGYSLALSPDQIKMLTLIELFEGPIEPVSCLTKNKLCGFDCSCIPRKFWQGLKQSIETYLDSCTIQDLLEDTHE
ncbi:MAG TPA: Rrf2 family transcriptional regulator [Spirochaetia bacterium]|nr:Rrf2 family transcriptional regulator [Spirochaetales bacterium]HRS65354.1 Rrf2 family transcriptional regulator [Spirochaetia bacterium]HOT59666.1 Rrf2 family transcriptional regulator [Spirochaetales bacterium]HPD79796.1 Rrf2 family transcriptional regulator [Spirochaetales bacterium]HQG39735.1 Rrf2 family transcriptional regulator [Spirochaetales bacterium]